MSLQSCYRKISELSVGDKRVNVFGVVTLFRPPSKSRGSDFSCTVEIADESSTGNPLTCILFHPDPGKLPQQCKIGDVICLLRMNISEFNTKLQGTCFKSAGHVMFEGSPSVEVTPTSTSEPSSAIGAEERQRVMELRQWAATNQHFPDGSRGSSSTTGGSHDATFDPSLKMIRDLREGDKRVSVVGVVKYFKPPTQTKSGDHFITLTIIDVNTQDQGEGFNCFLFNPTERKLPHSCAPGDVVLFRGLYVSKYEGALVGKGYERTARALFFSGQPESRIEPRVGVYGPSCTVSQEEEKRVRETKRWAQDNKELWVEVSCKLQDVVVGQYCNMNCQVVSTAVSYPTFTPITILTVWDGTELPLVCRKIDTDIERHFHTDFNPAVRYASHGLTQDVIIRGIRQHQIIPRSFVRLVNVCASLLSEAPSDGEQPIGELCIQRDPPKSGTVIVLPDDSTEVREVRKQLPTPMEPLPVWRQPHFLPPPSTTVALDQNTKRWASLKTILEFPQVPYKFISSVKVDRVSPNTIEEFCQLRCPECKHRYPTPKSQDGLPQLSPASLCPHCKEKALAVPPKLAYMYVFSLMVSDSTADGVELYISDSDAARFLPDLPPMNLYTDTQTKETLLSKLYYLTGGNDPFFALPPDCSFLHPGMVCGILSYRASNGTVCYRIFDTVLTECEQDPVEDEDSN